MSKRDYYQVLGIKRDATNAQIKSAYRRLARKNHPDVSQAPDASEKFQEATEAYEVLSDSKKRQMYDQFGHEGPTGGPGWPGGGYGRPGPKVDFEEIFGAGGESGFFRMSLEEILASLGGGRHRRKPRKSVRQRGADVQHAIDVDFMRAIYGTTVTMRLAGPGGRGGGETIDVKIPAGIRSGTKIRVRGKGGEGPGGRGDLYIIPRIKPHPYFRRDGDDITVEVPISITEAMLGAKVDVPAIDGMTTVTIPPGTDGSRRLRLRGKGVGGVGGRPRGDQYIVIRVVPPGKLTSRGKELLREFEAENPYDPRSEAPWKKNASRDTER